MIGLGLVIANANYSDVFNTADIYNLDFFVKETESVADFISEIYNIYRPWEKECLEEFFLEKMRWQTIFYQYRGSSFVVVSNSFTEKNIEKKTDEFMQVQYEIAEKISPVVAFKTINEKEISVFLVTGDSKKASIKIVVEKNMFGFSFTNSKLIENFFDIKTNDFKKLIDDCCNFNELVTILSEKLKLPLDMTFEKVRRNQKKLNAVKFDTRE